MKCLLVSMSKKKVKTIVRFVSYNGRSQTVSGRNGTYSDQIKTLVVKQSNLKYYVPIEFLEQVTGILRYVYMLRSKSSLTDFISKLGNTLHLIIYVLFLKASTIYRNPFSPTLRKLLYGSSKVIFRQAI